MVTSRNAEFLEWQGKLCWVENGWNHPHEHLSMMKKGFCCAPPEVFIVQYLFQTPEASSVCVKMLERGIRGLESCFLLLLHTWLTFFWVHIFLGVVNFWINQQPANCTLAKFRLEHESILKQPNFSYPKLAKWMRRLGGDMKPLDFFVGQRGSRTSETNFLRDVFIFWQLGSADCRTLQCLT